MKEEKGKFEEMIRSKLYDFESDTNADDWDGISARLPAGKEVKLFPWKKYISIAAAIALLAVLVGGLYYFNYESKSGLDPGANYAAETTVTHEGTDARLHEWSRVGETLAIAQTGERENGRTGERINGRTAERENGKRDERSEIEMLPLASLENIRVHVAPAVRDVEKEMRNLSSFLDETQPLLAMAEMPDAIAGPSKPRRRWGFGMGGGSMGVSSGSGGLSSLVFDAGPAYSYSPDAEQGILSNKESSLFAGLSQRDIPYATDIRHRTPVSFGLGVHYDLSDRWSLQSGLVYTQLRSDWTINNQAFVETNEYIQRLHYLGVPLSVSYRLGQWKNLRFYASAGGMAEYNIAGSLKSTMFYNGERLTERINIEMKEPLFSVQSRLGVAFPVWRFVGIYAETGASYYFDNKSLLKTIRSDKPFTVSLQAGINLGF
ncbi:MAG: PorT family protein [Tannerella sp.]|jgi:hypothetical protein|nr:PorT family protein [Tannerella sp.]